MNAARQYIFDEPFFLQWHITGACNQSCSHCYRGTAASADLPFESLLIILDGFTALLASIGRPGRIQFTGGEPFLSPHLFALINRATSRGISTRILSNGTCITNDHHAQLKATKCDTVQVSIDGTEQAHDGVRGSGSWRAAWDGVARLRAAGFTVTINMTLSRANAADVRAVGERAASCAHRFAAGRLVPAGKAAANDMLDPAGLRACFDAIHAVKRRHRSLDVPLRDPVWHEYLRVSPARYPHAVHGCSAGYNGLAIEADGTVYPCRRLPISLGNALETPLTDLWRTAPLLALLRDRDALTGSCGKCPRRWLCGGCRGIAWAVSNDCTAEDPQCFRQTGLRRWLPW